MRQIKENSIINRIINCWRNEKLTYKGCKIFNTPWAKDKNTNERDIVNCACFIEFEINGKLVYYLPTDTDIQELSTTYNEVGQYNRGNDRVGQKYLKAIYYFYKKIL